MEPHACPWNVCYCSRQALCKPVLIKCKRNLILISSNVACSRYDIAGNVSIGVKQQSLTHSLIDILRLIIIMNFRWRADDKAYIFSITHLLTLSFDHCVVCPSSIYRF